MKFQLNNEHQRGTATVEFALTSSAFFLMLIAIIAGGLLFWTKNALVETTRRAAHYAATHAAATPAGTVTTGTNVGPSITAIRNVALYGNDAGTGSKLIESLNASNIDVQYNNFGVAKGTVSVSISSYNYHFQIPGINQTISLGPFRTTVVGESAGTLP